MPEVWEANRLEWRSFRGSSTSPSLVHPSQTLDFKDKMSPCGVHLAVVAQRERTRDAFTALFSLPRSLLSHPSQTVNAHVKSAFHISSGRKVFIDEDANLPAVMFT